MIIPRHILSTTALVCGVIMFFLISLLGFFYVDMTMSHCPFMHDMGVCTMSPLEHITAWHGISASIFQKQNYSAPFFLLAFAALFNFIRFRYIRFRYVPSLDSPSPQRSYHARHRFIPPITFLEEFFSNGVLNPKIF